METILSQYFLPLACGRGIDVERRPLAGWGRLGRWGCIVGDPFVKTQVT